MGYEVDFFNSPIGWLKLFATEQGLAKVEFIGSSAVDMQRVQKSPILLKTKEQLQEYFFGGRQTFDLPLALCGSEFQLKAWSVLQKIPFGKTISYGEQAKALNKKGAARAVGGANNRNPIPIVVPCHRVIGQSGQLTGYAGGLDKKKWLLSHESCTTP